MTENDLMTARIVCRHRHPLEWTARQPRTTACDQCLGITELVLSAAFGRL